MRLQMIFLSMVAALVLACGSDGSATTTGADGGGGGFDVPCPADPVATGDTCPTANQVCPVPGSDGCYTWTSDATCASDLRWHLTITSSVDACCPTTEPNMGDRCTPNPLAVDEAQHVCSYADISLYCAVDHWERF